MRWVKGINITYPVKRNNFAPAQYEAKMCCTAQIPVFPMEFRRPAKVQPTRIVAT
jgi:hypothetical protein